MSNIPFRVKRLTYTAKLPHRNCESDLWDLFADGFCAKNLEDIEHGEAMYGYDINHEENLNFETHLNCFDRNHLPDDLPNKCKIYPRGRILVKTGIALELPKLIKSISYKSRWFFDDVFEIKDIEAYAVADLRPRSGLALKHGITVLNAPATIDNSYRKEIGVILYNAGHEPYTINKGDKIAQMLIRPLYPSKMEIVDNVEDTGRGGYNSTGY
jgi:dUTPase